MLRWLEVLGPLKWPSILLVLSPIAAYPFWDTRAVPMESCGPVAWRGQAYEAYASPGGDELVLRQLPTIERADQRPRTALADDLQPLRYDPGSVVLARPGDIRCTSQEHTASNPR
jgi:hypothetical protein